MDKQEKLNDRTTWRTGITNVGSDGVRIRGYSVLDLARKADFATTVGLLWKGELPTPQESRMIDAMLVAMADHSISPPSIVSRYVASGGVPLASSLAAGLLIHGEIVGGSDEPCARLLQEGVARMKENGQTVDEVAARIVEDARAEGRRLPGFGHPGYPNGDPRVLMFFELAQELGLAGAHIELVQAVEKALQQRVSSPIAINIHGGIASVTSDMGYAPGVANGWIELSRVAGLVAQVHEEETRGRGWRTVPSKDVVYDGPAPRDVPDHVGRGALDGD